MNWTQASARLPVVYRHLGKGMGISPYPSIPGRPDTVGLPSPPPDYENSRRNAAITTHFISMVLFPVLQSCCTRALVHSRTNTLDPGSVSLQSASTCSVQYICKIHIDNHLHTVQILHKYIQYDYSGRRRYRSAVVDVKHCWPIVSLVDSGALDAIVRHATHPTGAKKSVGPCSTQGLFRFV